MYTISKNLSLILPLYQSLLMSLVLEDVYVVFQKNANWFQLRMFLFPLLSLKTVTVAFLEKTMTWQLHPRQMCRGEVFEPKTSHSSNAFLNTAPECLRFKSPLFSVGVVLAWPTTDTDTYLLAKPKSANELLDTAKTERKSATITKAQSQFSHLAGKLPTPPFQVWSPFVGVCIVHSLTPFHLIQKRIGIPLCLSWPHKTER